MRNWRHHIFTFPAGSDTSNACFLGSGAFGTLLVPASLNGGSVNFITDMTVRTGYTDGITTPSDFDAVDLMASDLSLTTGANPLDSTNIQEVGAAGWVKLQLAAAVVDETQVILWWKD